LAVAGEDVDPRLRGGDGEEGGGDGEEGGGDGEEAGGGGERAGVTEVNLTPAHVPSAPR
jgi:hypothetical protein